MVLMMSKVVKVLSQGQSAVYALTGSDVRAKGKRQTVAMTEQGMVFSLGSCEGNHGK